MAKRKGRRGPGEGSIFQLPEGRWRATVSLGFRRGKRWRKSFEAPTLAAVQRKITAARRQHQLGYNIAPEQQTVGQFLAWWLEHVKPDIRPATFISYEGTVRLHLVPALGKIGLGRLRAQQVQQLKQEQLASGLSARSVAYSLRVLRMALQEALRLELVARNVTLLVDYPSVEQEEIRPFTPDQARQFLGALRGHRLEALFSAALALGLRKGEALGLQWPDIDFERGLLSVRRAVQRLKMPGEKKGRIRTSEPKRGSRRTIHLPQVAVHALLEHWERQDQERRFAGDRWKEGGYVFTSGIGTLLEARAVNQAFAELLEKAGLPRIRVHDLRHNLRFAAAGPGRVLQGHPGDPGALRHPRHHEPLRAPVSGSEEGGSREDGRRSRSTGSVRGSGGHSEEAKLKG